MMSISEESLELPRRAEVVSRGVSPPPHLDPHMSGQGEKRIRGGELDSPDERHHLLHDVFAEGDDDEEFLWEETAQVRPDPDR